MKNILLLVIFLIITGCATAGMINGVQLGMTQEEVVTIMGKPVSVSAQGGSKYLNYKLSETDDDAFRGWTIPYYVRLIDGKVESFGRAGDFDSTQKPTIRIERKDDVNLNVKRKPDLYSELKKLKELRNDGILTEEEFQTQKKKILEQH